MKTGAAVLMMAVLAVGLVSQVDAQLPTPTPRPTATPRPLDRFHMRLKRPGQSPVIPTLGDDVWRMSADLNLPLNFDPNLKPIDVTVSVPNGGPHVNPLHVQQVLPVGKRWTILATTANNGDCRVTLVPRYTKWTLSIRCRGTMALPPFPTSTEFNATVQIGDRVFASGVKEFRHLRTTLRRYP